MPKEKFAYSITLPKPDCSSQPMLVCVNIIVALFKFMGSMAVPLEIRVPLTS